MYLDDGEKIWLTPLIPRRRDSSMFESGVGPRRGSGSDWRLLKGRNLMRVLLI
ncbi:MAG: hypothetical protein ACI81O_001420 [Cyclobacteriaceae bacterium]|jgi:hypothetical protein